MHMSEGNVDYTSVSTTLRYILQRFQKILMKNKKFMVIQRIELSNHNTHAHSQYCYQNIKISLIHVCLHMLEVPLLSLIIKKVILAPPQYLKHVRFLVKKIDEFIKKP
jgi:hypothetical protein